jgi:protein TonB
MATSRYAGFAAALMLAGVATPAFAQEPVRVGGAVKEPRKIKHVEPEYPMLALQARVQGTVILEARIDKTGAVADVKVLRSFPLLDDAAMAAVRQWTYTPTLLENEPVEVLLIVTVNFQVKDGAAKPPAQPAEPGSVPVRVGGEVKEPTKTKHVPPVYPVEAMRDKVQGTVILEATLSKTGTVGALKILKGVDDRLDKAAIEAVQKWEYTPTTINDVPVEVLLVVTVAFRLK